jgi:hypothetical protein
LNIEQDIQELADVVLLPHDPSQLPVVIVRKPNGSIPTGYREFTVRRHVIRRWLRWLKKNNPLYQDIIINDEEIESLPGGDNGGCIADRLTQVEESDAALSQQVDAALQQALAPNPNDDDNDDDDDDLPENQQEQGPFQNGATGAPLEERMVEESYIGRPLEQNEDEEQELRTLVNNVLGGGQLTVDWPAAGSIVDEYNFPSLQASAFPTLFPYGVGDVTKKDRQKEVTLTESNKHLVQYAVWKPDEKVWSYPFQEHPRWAFWAHNVSIRHRHNTQKSVYTKQNEGDANLTIEELQDIVDDPDPTRLRQLLGRMNKYTANINGSPAKSHERNWSC